jgi:hypothetical protein
MARLTKCFWLEAALYAAWTCAACAADSAAGHPVPFAVTVRGGSVIGLQRPGWPALVVPPREPRGAGIHRVAATHWAAERHQGTLSGGSAERTYGEFAELPGAAVEGDFRFDAATGETIIRQQARSPAKGVWGVSWSIADIPLDRAILVPGGSGLKLSRDTPGTQHEFDYPITWEIPLVVVEGKHEGFYVWAEDPCGRYKRLVVERRPSGWRLGLVTINDAPFDELAACESVAWRLGVYEGDWRVPTRRYRDWLEEHGRPVRIERQQPGWVKDIRACVIMGLDLSVLEALPRRLDPRQTLLYLPDWRAAGYDRDYPEYDKPKAELEPFLRRARELGFRTMLHVNYFGVDPLNRLYRQFERYHVRSPWGKHEKQWWVWPPEKPDIRFAYINPAAKVWRAHFVGAMQRLCRRTGVDALHLDQTLCIDNDHNGRIDGLSMLEGNLALHRDLREALPGVALSGEGLNEVTCRYEAFAQRHVWGLDHTKGTWDRRWLAAAHPISSYVLRPFTTLYGYLGCAPPEADQTYAAWAEAYRHFGVIPTLKPRLDSLDDPHGFARQFFDEAALWQRERLAVDLDGPWPADAVFPYRTADGRRVMATTDRRLLCGSEEISRTVTGVRQVEAAGTIPGWRAFDERRLLGLRPDRWYPYFPTPRDPTVFHVCRMPERLAIGGVADLGDLGVVQTQDPVGLVADLGALLDRATCGTRPHHGKPFETIGQFEAPDGGAFGTWGDTISAHPPWKGGSSGEAFARYTVTLPQEGTLRLAADVALDAGAVGPEKSDGVTFSVRAIDGGKVLVQEVHHAKAEPRALVLDLTPLRGRTIALELAVGPGPKGSPSFDWARWHRPRVEQSVEGEGILGVAGGKDTSGGTRGERSRRWALAIGPAGEAPIRQDGEVQEVRVPMPGGVCFLARAPEVVGLPLDLSRATLRLLFVTDSGQVLSSAEHAAMMPRANTVGGVSREGLFAHPPDHGRAMAFVPMRLPTEPARLETWVGVRDGSRSDGMRFAVEINGREVAARHMLPGAWERLVVDLAPWSGQSIVVALVTDSEGPFICDWGCWGEPRIIAATSTRR